jgi:hypothetical protein
VTAAVRWALVKAVWLQAGVVLLLAAYTQAMPRFLP